MTLTNVKAGDRIAIIRRDRYKGEYPSSLSQVNKVTPKRIYTSMGQFWDIVTGKPLHSTKGQWVTQGVRISADIADIQPLLDQEAAQDAEHKRRQQEKEKREARKTYQLACEITASWSKDPIADLELLGEEKLQEIVDLIAKAKENA